ncbi:MAG: tetratricopeptide repeat protein [Lewinella sp.]|nr:tetratricopeptide repeat protein [Lewinella sp.]
METKHSYVDKLGNTRIGVFSRFARVIPYMVINTGMLVHHVCAFLEGLLGPMHCEFERTPKTGSVTAAAVAINNTTTPKKTAKSIRKYGKPSYLITELVFLTTQFIWIFLFASKGMLFAAAGASWIVACTIGIRAAPLVQAYLQRRFAQQSKVMFNIWSTTRVLLFLVFYMAAGTINSQNADADKTVEFARQAARENQHTEAIKAYRSAIDAAPERRREWLLELADQLTWAGRLGEATKLYREAADTDEERTERLARRGLARALSWDGRHKESITEYKLLLEEDPENYDLQLALAEVLVWDNRLKEALAQYNQLLRDHPNDIRGMRGKNRILSWRGRHRKAVVDLQKILLQIRTTGKRL